jgi:hypothetical protein
MPGFPDISAIVNALSVSKYGQRIPWMKLFAASTAAGGRYTMWPQTGTPDAGVYTGSALTATQATSATTGAIPYTNPGGSRDMFVLALKAACSASPGTVLLWDRLVYYPTIDHTSALLQTFTNGVGLPRATTGVGVRAFLETTTALGASAQNATLLYQDPDGNETAAQTSGALAMVASSAIARIPHATNWFPFAAGDTGMLRATSIQFSAGNTQGVSCLVLAQLIAEFQIPEAGSVVTEDLVRGAFFSIPELEASSCLFFTHQSAATGSTPEFHGMLQLCEN